MIKDREVRGRAGLRGKINLILDMPDASLRDHINKLGKMVHGYNPHNPEAE
jgi:hypothetical protein